MSLNAWASKRIVPNYIYEKPVLDSFLQIDHHCEAGISLEGSVEDPNIMVRSGVGMAYVLGLDVADARVSQCLWHFINGSPLPTV